MRSAKLLEWLSSLPPDTEVLLEDVARNSFGCEYVELEEGSPKEMQGVLASCPVCKSGAQNRGCIYCHGFGPDMLMLEPQHPTSSTSPAAIVLRRGTHHIWGRHEITDGRTTTRKLTTT